ncbi:MAG: histidine--tRNA ligase [Candidatus Marsarchaeota archaeon]|nr:histidine--tRNA ligase [Candidatus Marsarchaeota archaeon]
MNDELLQPPKGFRDYAQEEEIARKKILKIIENEFINYGFLPIQTSAVESFEVLSGKFANSEDTDVFKEIYFFEDKGGRKLGLRYDLTVPFGRVIASNPKIPLPFKRYEIGLVWRDGPVKVGRYREFTQCDADIVGVEGGIAEAELFALAQSVFKKLDLKFSIEVGNRKVLDSFLQFCGVKSKKAMITIDKLKKIGFDGVEKELKERGVSSESIERIKQYSLLKGDASLQELGKILTDENGIKGLNEVKEVLNYCKAFKVENVEFDLFMARGLDYYTGTVFEAFLAGDKITSSIAAGGRYENLIKDFGGRQMPATGISFGVDVLLEGLNKTSKTNVKVLVIPIKNISNSIKIIQTLRENSISSLIDYSERSLGKNLEYASKQEIPFVIIVGDQELKEGKVVFRNMSTGEQKTITIEQAVQQLQNT